MLIIHPIALIYLCKLNKSRFPQLRRSCIATKVFLQSLGINGFFGRKSKMIPNSHRIVGFCRYLVQKILPRTFSIIYLLLFFSFEPYVPFRRFRRFSFPSPSFSYILHRFSGISCLQYLQELSWMSRALLFYIKTHCFLRINSFLYFVFFSVIIIRLGTYRVSGPQRSW